MLAKSFIHVPEFNRDFSFDIPLKFLAIANIDDSDVSLVREEQYDLQELIMLDFLSSANSFSAFSAVRFVFSLATNPFETSE